MKFIDFFSGIGGFTRGMELAGHECVGFPCQDISIAGKQRGFKGNRSSLFFRVTALLKQLSEEDRPNYLFIENVRNLLSVNRGFDSDFSLSWTKSGTMRSGKLSTQNTTVYHKTESECSLLDILEDEVDEKYFLSREQAEKIVFAK